MCFDHGPIQMQSSAELDRAVQDVSLVCTQYGLVRMQPASGIQIPQDHTISRFPHLSDKS